MPHLEHSTRLKLYCINCSILNNKSEVEFKCAKMACPYTSSPDSLKNLIVNYYENRLHKKEKQIGEGGVYA